MAKEVLRSIGKGYIVEAIENHYDLSDYRTSFRDSALFSKAYIEDMASSLSVAQEQNTRILNEYDLADCLQ